MIVTSLPAFQISTEDGAPVEQVNNSSFGDIESPWYSSRPLNPLTFLIPSISLCSIAMQYFSVFPVPATAGFPLEFYRPNSGQCICLILPRISRKNLQPHLKSTFQLPICGTIFSFATLSIS
jgi:hypothetical protein